MFLPQFTPFSHSCNSFFKAGDVFVTFWYQRHNDDLIVIEKVHAYEFISRIIIHIPDYNFKQIRFYGAYHNSTKLDIEVTKIISKEKNEFFSKLTSWRTLILSNFEIDPLTCPICNNISYTIIISILKKGLL